MHKKQQEDAPWREPYDMDSFQEPEPSLNLARVARKAPLHYPA